MKYQTLKCTGLHPDKLPNECGAIFLPRKSETCPKCGANHFCRGPVIDLPDFEKIRDDLDRAMTILNKSVWDNDLADLKGLVLGVIREVEQFNE